MDQVVNYSRLKRINTEPIIQRKPLFTTLDVICVAIIALAAVALYGRFNSKQQYHQRYDILDTL